MHNAHAHCRLPDDPVHHYGVVSSAQSTFDDYEDERGSKCFRCVEHTRRQPNVLCARHVNSNIDCVYWKWWKIESIFRSHRKALDSRHQRPLMQWIFAEKCCKIAVLIYSVFSPCRWPVTQHNTKRGDFKCQHHIRNEFNLAIAGTCFAYPSGKYVDVDSILRCTKSQIHRSEKSKIGPTISNMKYTLDTFQYFFAQQTHASTHIHTQTHSGITVKLNVQPSSSSPFDHTRI